MTTKYANKFREKSSASFLEDITDIIQHFGNAERITTFDANSGYHQCPVKQEELTAFVQ